MILIHTCNIPAQNDACQQALSFKRKTSPPHELYTESQGDYCNYLLIAYHNSTTTQPRSKPNCEFRITNNIPQVAIIYTLPHAVQNAKSQNVESERQLSPPLSTCFFCCNNSCACLCDTPFHTKVRVWRQKEKERMPDTS
jgi:hypothetical protein